MENNRKRNIYVVENFTKIETLETPNENRATFVEGEEELAKKNGFTEAEIKASIQIVKKLIRSLIAVGYLQINPIKVFKSKDGHLYIIDGNHIVRAILELKKEGKNIPVTLLVYKETENFTYNDACYQMVMMNKEGSTPWSFIDIMRWFNTPNSTAFLELYKQYNKSVSAVAVVADSAINTPTSTKRGSLDALWATTTNMVWPHANDYLSLLSTISRKSHRKFSQAASDALRKIYTCAVEYGVDSLVKGVFEKAQTISLSFPKGRPTTKEWGEAFLKAIPKRIPNLSTAMRRNYKNFLEVAKCKVDLMESKKNNYITISEEPKMSA